MKKLFFLAAVVCLSTVAAFSQAKPSDFSGTWALDVSKSKLDARARIESMTMTVTQTDKELKVATETKRTPPPADAPAGAPGAGSGGGGGMGRGGGSGDSTSTYSLDGKETTVEIDGPNGKMPVKYKATIDGAKASLSQSRTFSGGMGEVTVTTKESWTLSADGKSLTVERENTSPRGTTNSTLVFAKK